MKKVYICAPLGGSVQGNLENARKYARYVLTQCGAAPVVPHFYAMLLDDNAPDERELGMAASRNLLWFCDECWIFGDNITEGMREEIELCRHLNIKTRYITGEETSNIQGGITA